MADLRTAAQQALEALGKGCNVKATEWHQAIYDLRAALAQQAEPGEPVAWMDPASGDVISDARHEAWERDFGLAGKGKAALFTVPLYTAPPQRPAEPVQEPVGTVRVDAGEVHIVPLVRDADRSALKDGQPVYAAPPQRKPLTVEEIAELARQEQFLLICDGLEELTEITRAVEAKHGIKE